jgi:hypothetical protein
MHPNFDAYHREANALLNVCLSPMEIGDTPNDPNGRLHIRTEREYHTFLDCLKPIWERHFGPGSWPKKWGRALVTDREEAK